MDEWKNGRMKEQEVEKLKNEGMMGRRKRGMEEEKKKEKRRKKIIRTFFGVVEGSVVVQGFSGQDGPLLVHVHQHVGEDVVAVHLVVVA